MTWVLSGRMIFLAPHLQCESKTLTPNDGLASCFQLIGLLKERALFPLIQLSTERAEPVLKKSALGFEPWTSSLTPHMK